MAGCGQWSARRCIRAAASRRWCCSRCSGRPSSRSSTSAAAATSTPRTRWAPASSAAWPRRSRSTTSPRSAPPTSATPRSASATCSSPRAPAASWPRPGAPRTGGRSSTASPAPTSSTPTCSRRSSCSNRPGGADARASDDLRSAAGLTQILAETGQNLLGLHIDVKASERLTRGILRGHRVPGARGRPPARRRALRPGQGDRGDGALPGLRQGQARPRRPRRRLLPHGRGQPAAGAHGLREGRRPLRAAVLRLEPAAPRRRRGASWPSLGDDSSTYLWRVLAAREIMRQYRADPEALQREAVLQSHKASAEEVLHPADAHAGLRRPLRHRPRAGVGRAARRSTRRSSPRTG